MKILLCGVFSNPGSTDNWKLRALRRLGHRVVPWPYRERDTRELGPQGEPFDLVFVSKGAPCSAETLAHLRSLGRAGLIFWPDPPGNWTDDLSAAVRSGGWRVSATSPLVLAEIRHRVAASFEGAVILEGCDCDPYWPDDVERPAEEIEPALLHFGALTDRRVEIIERVRDARVRVDHLERPLYGSDLQREVLRYAAVLGINSSPLLWSNRVQTVLAMGGCILQERGERGSVDLRTYEGRPVPLGTWWEATLPSTAVAAIECRAEGRSLEGARDIQARHSWEACMTRALDFVGKVPA